MSRENNDWIINESLTMWDYNSIRVYEEARAIFLETEQVPPAPIQQSGTRALVRRVKRGIARRLRLNELPGVAPQTRVKHLIFSERLVEYPLFYRHFDLEKGSRVLEFGCVESLLAMQLATLGYKVTGLDFRPYPFTHENFEFIESDILSWQPLSDKFDAVVSISVVEHIGLSAYGDPVARDGDKIAVQKLLESLKPGGRLYLTIPAGRPPQERGWYRVYDSEAINNLVPNIEILLFFWKPERYGTWRECRTEEIDGFTYDDYFSTLAPVQGVAFIVARKEE